MQAPWSLEGKGAGKGTSEKTPGFTNKGELNVEGKKKLHAPPLGKSGPKKEGRENRTNPPRKEKNKH